jgi:hypothetical protein
MRSRGRVHNGGHGGVDAGNVRNAAPLPTHASAEASSPAFGLKSSRKAFEPGCMTNGKKKFGGCDLEDGFTRVGMVVSMPATFATLHRRSARRMLQRNRRPAFGLKSSRKRSAMNSLCKSSNPTPWGVGRQRLRVLFEERLTRGAVTVSSSETWLDAATVDWPPHASAESSSSVRRRVGTSNRALTRQGTVRTGDHCCFRWSRRIDAGRNGITFSGREFAP